MNMLTLSTSAKAVLARLEKGPATCRQLKDDIGFKSEPDGALASLMAAGLVKRTRTGTGKRSPFVYSLGYDVDEIVDMDDFTARPADVQVRRDPLIVALFGHGPAKSYWETSQCGI
ncbi:hypothetical protein [Massilia sp. TS11]|uniref:hypothetical protein n=1 Tax=Massilia sp. TS11 TaxID=2908003 RepID=UPI001EDB440C|nr:hypothetical protein [Massilia sp. TS11]MCG2586542.1 hypothetical protein [Massilia sp. TS11]